MGVRVIYGLTLIVLLIGTLRGEGSVFDYFKLRTSLVILEETIHKIEETNTQLNTEIFKIKKSPDYARKVLRDKYHITDSDEKIIFFAD